VTSPYKCPLMSSPLSALPLEMRLAGGGLTSRVRDAGSSTVIPRGKVMTVEGFLQGRRLQMARGVLLQAGDGRLSRALLRRMRMAIWLLARRGPISGCIVAALG